VMKVKFLVALLIKMIEKMISEFYHVIGIRTVNLNI
jgi:hypothetical protein